MYSISSAMQRCRLLDRVTRCSLSSISPKIRPYGLPLVCVAHHQARGTHQDIAPQDNAPRFDYIEDGEPPHRYCPGGYHPLSIGDVLHQRYRVVHKLGFGGYSTIWLAKDINQPDSHIAIKIKVAEADDDSKETQIWRHLWTAANEPQQPPLSLHPTSPKVPYSIPPIWDEFTIDGPNGTHRCVGTVPARMTVADAQEASWTRLFQLKVARVIVAQLVKAVAFMHGRGYVHADLHLGNVLLAFPKSIHEMSDKFFETFSPRLEPVTIVGDETERRPLPSGMPSHIVIPAWFGAKSEDIKLGEASVILADFGEAFSPFTEKRFHSRTLWNLRPPEARFAPEKPLSFPADVWTLACSIWAILGIRSSVMDVFFATEDNVTRDQVEALGKLPEEWWAKWDARSEYFDNQGNLLDDECPRRSLDVRFEDSIQQPRRERGMESIGDEERLALLAMLRAMLAYVPEERPSAASLLDCEWMVKWALPDLRDVDKASH